MFLNPVHYLKGVRVFKYSSISQLWPSLRDSTMLWEQIDSRKSEHQF